MLLACAVCLSSCSTLTVPGAGKPAGDDDAARAVLEKSSKTSGSAWTRYQQVEVAYDGEWTGIVKRLQPDLVDPEFRKSSVETYRPRSGRVVQEHRGPGGSKRVVRRPGDVEVSYNGQAKDDATTRDAAALVADAYTAFLFGSSWLDRKGGDLVLLEPVEYAGETCERVQGVLRPGFGFVPEDRFIAWIGRESGWLRRLQFSIDGLASTRGADVDVAFSEHWKAPDGSVWPGRFVEWVQRPVLVKAHEWTMTGLTLDGKKVR
jgi:hypothetical protein